MKLPGSLDELQRIVDAANAFAAVEGAREYGLTIGGPQVNLLECLAIMEEGAAHGVRPDPRAIGALIAEICKEDDSNGRGIAEKPNRRPRTPPDRRGG